MKITLLWCLVTVSAFASGVVKPLIKLPEDKSIQCMVGSSTLLLVGFSDRAPYQLGERIQLEPDIRVAVYREWISGERLQLGRGALRELIRLGDAFLAAVVSYDESAAETARFYLIGRDLKIRELPSLHASMVGLLKTPAGLLFYSHLAAWQLNPEAGDKEWKPVPLHPDLIKTPIRAMSRLADGSWGVYTEGKAHGVPALDRAPVWTVSYPGIYNTAVGAGRRFWLVTSESDQVTFGYLDPAKGALVPTATFSKRVAMTLVRTAGGFLLLSGRAGWNGDRDMQRLDHEGRKVGGLSSLPYTTNGLFVLDDMVVVSNNRGEIFEFRP